MESFKKIEAAWGISLPSEFKAIYGLAEVDAVKLKNGQIMDLLWPLLHPEEIARQATLAKDWEIPSGLMPFMGDMHSLVCLDYRQGQSPSVVFLNDARDITPLFSSIPEFIAAITQPDESKSSSSGIILTKSWLDF